MLSPSYTVSVTRGEILHVGESISNLTFLEGDILSNLSTVTFTEMVRSLHYTMYTQALCILSYCNILQGVTVNFGRNILNAHDNVIDSDDLIIVRIEAYISTNSTTELENQTITFRGEILETPPARDTIQLELVHPQLQVCSICYS